MIIRPEMPSDQRAIYQLTKTAFAGALHSCGREQDLIDALRDANALTLSLVAEINGIVWGHIAFTNVLIDGADLQWHGLGPVSVHPDHHGKGIGRSLIAQGLKRLEQNGSLGCVVLGDPGYYARFGFRADPHLTLENAPPEYFLARAFCSGEPTGMVTFHPLFLTVM